VHGQGSVWCEVRSTSHDTPEHRDTSFYDILFCGADAVAPRLPISLMLKPAFVICCTFMFMILPLMPFFFSPMRVMLARSIFLPFV